MRSRRHPDSVAQCALHAECGVREWEASSR
jgi:hypothetical protein